MKKGLKAADQHDQHDTQEFIIILLGHGAAFGPGAVHTWAEKGRAEGRWTRRGHRV